MLWLSDVLMCCARGKNGKHLGAFTALFCLMMFPCIANAQITSSEGGKDFEIRQDAGSGDLIFENGGSERMRINNTTGKVTIGKGLLVGGSPGACDGTSKGTLHYSCGRPVYCNGTSWVPWPPGAADRNEKLLAFVSSTAVTGDVMSTGGFDTMCNNLAKTAGISGYFKAWVTETGSTAAQRFEQSTCSYRYYLVDGSTIVANSYADLTDGTLSNPINKDETGAVYNGNVWTSSGTSGGGAGGSYCGEWRVGTNASTGIYGTTTSATSTWTNAGTANCDSSFRFMCFEQAAYDMSLRYPRIFLSSKKFTGDIAETSPSVSSTYSNAGVGGAHAACQAMANNASLGGSWNAWIAQPTSTLGSAPNSYFKKSVSAPYVTVTNLKIANNWTDLTDGSLDMGIVVDEFGARINDNSFAWTNVDNSGIREGSAQATAGCGATSVGWDQTSGTANVGYPGRAGGTWGNAVTPENCTSSGRLLCFEQAHPVFTAYKNIFVTSTTHNGNLGGIAGADAICQARAQAGGLTGTYKAWLTDGTATNAPNSTFAQSSVPYRLLDGRIVAENYTDLVTGNDSTGGTIYTPINITELGSIVKSGTGAVWTNTTVAGARKGSTAGTNHCTNWTNSSAGQSGSAGIPFTMTEWTDKQTYTCNSMNRLYCVEQ